MTKTVVFDPMKPRPAFAYLAQKLIDLWISQPNEGTEPSTFLKRVEGRLSANMVLAVIEAAADGTVRADMIKPYGIPTSFQETRFPLGADFESVHGQFDHQIQKALRARRPVLTSMTVSLEDLRLDFEMLALPPAADASRDWCLVLGVINSILKTYSFPKDVDDVDHAIIQLLREGFQLREIGQRIKRSPRTVEHRIERLRCLLGARNLHDLVARSL
ncbi:AsnC family protein [Rhizobium anhuiense]|uniref:AsnC family protein n=1 Tax=Rhizobium anhuiense TaxID=1184720 RepID=UPI000BEA86A0|nr:AsnC family protein [Rhizobium anhuiense]PDS34690.1 AsnC family protein [Rhizobium anhuiense]